MICNRILENIKDYQFQSTFLWEWQKKTDLRNLSNQGMFDFLNIFINLFPCRNLVKLDLSYNVIYDLSGLKKIHGSSFSLQSLYLHGNELSSLDHLINCLAGCRMLQELTLSLYGEANPVCEIPDYQSSVLASLKNLEVLDGQDRTGKPAATRDSVLDIPGWILGFC